MKARFYLSEYDAYLADNPSTPQPTTPPAPSATTAPNRRQQRRIDNRTRRRERTTARRNARRAKQVLIDLAISLPQFKSKAAQRPTPKPIVS